VVTAMYVRHKSVAASKSLVQEVDMMVDTMKVAFSSTLQSLPWMSAPSRAAALEKLAGMMDLIGYPEQVLNSTWLNAKYSEVEVTDDYLMNIVAFQSHQRKEQMKVHTR
jgi:predicted metalloendopeptidase